MVSKGPNPFDGVYMNLPKKHHVLKKAKNCEFCNAKKFPDEGPTFCCRNGKVHIYILEVPSELRRLFTSQMDKDARYFRKHIRYFNSHFSFTSFKFSIDRRLASTRGTGLDPLVPHGKGPCHMQLYIYDMDDSIAHRDNPYVQVFTNLGTLANIQEYMIELNAKISVDQRRYNAPKMEQIAAIWVDGNNSQHRFSRSIVIYGKPDDPHYIRAYHGCYDPLPYPYTEGSRLYVSAREYKCYKLQIREGQLNMFFHARCLFKQLLVDWYVKVESMCLDWYSKPKHQALIRADLYHGLLNTLTTGEVDASKAGLRIVLSKDFSGSDRDVQTRFMDAMTLVARYGKPDYFMTMTCNPYWDEIMAELLPRQTPQDHPDIVDRVYHAKLLDLHDFLIKKGPHLEVEANSPLLQEKRSLRKLKRPTNFVTKSIKPLVQLLLVCCRFISSRSGERHHAGRPECKGWLPLSGWPRGESHTRRPVVITSGAGEARRHAGRCPASCRRLVGCNYIRGCCQSPSVCRWFTSCHLVSSASRRMKLLACVLSSPCHLLPLGLSCFAYGT
uniref:Helitron helicase-like domain-containing protein n=1 Tax=Setaria italica TaxID=4555 RepID=K3ZCU2_SETIT